MTPSLFQSGGEFAKVKPANRQERKESSLSLPDWGSSLCYLVVLIVVFLPGLRTLV